MQTSPLIKNDITALAAIRCLVFMAGAVIQFHRMDALFAAETRCQRYCDAEASLNTTSLTTDKVSLWPGGENIKHVMRITLAHRFTFRFDLRIPFSISCKENSWPPMMYFALLKN